MVGFGMYFTVTEVECFCADCSSYKPPQVHLHCSSRGQVVLLDHTIGRLLLFKMVALDRYRERAYSFARSHYVFRVAKAHGCAHSWHQGHIQKVLCMTPCPSWQVLYKI